MQSAVRLSFPVLSTVSYYEKNVFVCQKAGRNVLLLFSKYRKGMEASGFWDFMVRKTENFIKVKIKAMCIDNVYYMSYNI